MARTVGDGDSYAVSSCASQGETLPQPGPRWESHGQCDTYFSEYWISRLDTQRLYTKRATVREDGGASSPVAPVSSPSAVLGATETKGLR